MEYIEKNNISIPEAIKMWRKETQNNKVVWGPNFKPNLFFKADEDMIDEWLKETHYEKHKFEVGDFVIKENEKNKIGVVIDVKDYVYFKWFNNRCLVEQWTINKGDNKYHQREHNVYYMKDETLYKKVI